MNTLPHVLGSETSQAAAESMREHAGKQEQSVLAAIVERGPVGATTDELETQLGLSHQSASARVSTLKKQGAIVENGQRRKTRSGRNAAVYILSQS